MLKLNDKYLLDITQDFGADNPMEWGNLGTFLIIVAMVSMVLTMIKMD